MVKLKYKSKKKGKKKTNNYLLAILLACLLTWSAINSEDVLNPPIEVSVSEFEQDVVSGDVYEGDVIVSGNRIEYRISENEKRYAFKEDSALVQDILTAEQIENINILIDPVNHTLIRFIEQIMIAVIFICGGLFLISKLQSGQNRAMMFGKSKARTHDKKKDKTTFKSVAGAVEAKEELEEVVDFLKNPKKYQKIGAKIPKGVLLVGPPGTGKTLLARAVAGEANVPFFSISGSEFVEMFVGVGASRVRDMFKKAKRNSPCIIFIDEIDAVGRKRGAGLGGGNDEREQTLNQILTEMDGFDQGANIIIIAATNRPDVLDPALLRPGRFDRRVTVDSPGMQDREEILKVHSKDKPMAKSANLKTIAAHTPGMTGADLANIINEAAIYSAKNNKKSIGQKALEESVEKVLMGPARKSKVMSPKEKKITSYHEVGHALVGHLLSECDPVHKVSVVSRGMALGVTWSLPKDDINMYSKTKFNHKLAMMMGGYVAEEVFFGETSTGPSSDLQRATALAKRMVMEFGMSELGPMTFGEKKHEVFLGKDMAHTKNYSEAMAQKIDGLISEILHNAYDKAKELITEYKDLMVEISEDLLEKENLSRKEFMAYFEKAGIEAPLPN